MKYTRREFLATSATMTAILKTNPLNAFQRVSNNRDPWHLKMRRCAQHNLNEHDPKILDIDAWVKYWKEIKLEALILTAGGFIAMYPTQLPDHHRSQFLGEGDLFGDYLKACKKASIRVVGRIETNWAHQEILDSRPEWFERNKDLTPRPNPETPWVYRTCLFSDYRIEHIPKIIREIKSLYDVDGFFTNSWPYEGRSYLCFCESCKKEGDLSRSELSQRFIERLLETGSLIKSVIEENKTNCIYNVNIGGGIRAVQSLKKIASLAEWMTTDHQERGGTTPVWDCAQQGRVAWAVMKGRPVTNVVGTKSGPWRHATKAAAESTLWLAQTTSSGMIPWHVWLGSELPDRRWREIGNNFYQWLAKHEDHFFNKKPVARLGVVFSQRINELYNAPGRVPAGYGTVAGGRIERGDPTEYLQGAYYALLEGRFVFELIHEEDIQLDNIKKYSALILPNVALLSKAQISHLNNFVKGGGSLLTTFETGLYDELGKPRKEFALSNVFDIYLKSDYKGPLGHIFYTAINQKHEIVSGFGDTDRLPGGEWRIPLNADGKHPLTIVPPYPRGIPEMVYAHPRKELDYPGQKSEEPGLVIREKGASRLVYFPSDIERNIWRQGNMDLSKLYQQAIRWMIKDSLPVRVKGEGLVEIFAWETRPGYAVHILNYTNPNMSRAEIRKHYPLGPQKVRMELPEGTSISRGELLRAETKLPLRQTGQVVEFEIPKIEDFEVAALYSNSYN